MKYLIIFIFISISMITKSQTTIFLNDNIELKSNLDLSRILSLHKQKNEQTDELPGYRIQITSNNDRTKIYNLRSDVYGKFPDIKNYLKYEQPYYRLRIGDFKTRLEARKYLERVIRHFPSAFIVSDEVKVR